MGEQHTFASSVGEGHGRENEKHRDDSKCAYQDALQTLEHAQLVSLLALFKFLDGCTESVHDPKWETAV